MALSAAGLGAGLLVAALSFVSALGAIAVLMKLVDRVGFMPFVIYRFALGGALLIFAT